VKNVLKLDRLQACKQCEDAVLPQEESGLATELLSSAGSMITIAILQNDVCERLTTNHFCFNIEFSDAFWFQV